MTQIPSPKDVADARSARKDEFLDLCIAAVSNYDGTNPVSVPIGTYESFIAAATTALEGSGWAVENKNGNLIISAAKTERTKPETQPPFPGTVPASAVTPVSPPAAPTVTAPVVTAPVVVAAPASTASGATSGSSPATKPAGAGQDKAGTASRTFAVSKVQRGTRALATATPSAVLSQLVQTGIEACAVAGTSLIQPLGFHPLYEAAHHAFSSHYPLVFGPDDIWLTIAQGFARHVNLNPEGYRACFVSHEGKETIEIVRNEFRLGSPHNHWASVFADFSTAIGERIGENNQKLLVADFSTTGAIERAASEVVLMDCVQSYFRYKVNTLCGIPEVTLKGTAEDWQAVIDKTRQLAAFGGLDWWLDSVYPTLEQLHEVASGKAPNLSFWDNLYKGRHESGGYNASGWLMRLVPYVKYYDEKYHKNPLLERGSRDGFGVSCLPSALSFVPFIWNYLGTEYEYQFIAGHVGIEQDPSTFALTPRMGWAVRPANAPKLTEKDDD